MNQLRWGGHIRSLEALEFTWVMLWLIATGLLSISFGVWATRVHGEKRPRVQSITYTAGYVLWMAGILCHVIVMWNVPEENLILRIPFMYPQADTLLNVNFLAFWFWVAGAAGYGLSRACYFFQRHRIRRSSPVV
jgi:hypothetical protein